MTFNPPTANGSFPLPQRVHALLSAVANLPKVHVEHDSAPFVFLPASQEEHAVAPFYEAGPGGNLVVVHAPVKAHEVDDAFVPAVPFDRSEIRFMEEGRDRVAQRRTREGPVPK